MWIFYICLSIWQFNYVFILGVSNNIFIYYLLRWVRKFYFLYWRHIYPYDFSIMIISMIKPKSLANCKYVYPILFTEF